MRILRSEKSSSGTGKNTTAEISVLYDGNDQNVDFAQWTFHCVRIRQR